MRSPVPTSSTIRSGIDSGGLVEPNIDSVKRPSIDMTPRAAAQDPKPRIFQKIADRSGKRSKAVFQIPVQAVDFRPRTVRSRSACRCATAAVRHR